jgi:hypothetical protein
MTAMKPGRKKESEEYENKKIGSNLRILAGASWPEACAVARAGRRVDTREPRCFAISHRGGGI